MADSEDKHDEAIMFKQTDDAMITNAVSPVVA
jgi:hypothetical protein